MCVCVCFGGGEGLIIVGDFYILYSCSNYYLTLMVTIYSKLIYLVLEIKMGRKGRQVPPQVLFSVITYSYMGECGFLMLLDEIHRG